MASSILTTLRCPMLDDLLLVTLSEFQLRQPPKHEPWLRHARHPHHHHEGTTPMSDSTFDLGTFTQVPISAIVTDASGNVLSDKTVFSTPDSSVVTLQDQADGTTVAVRVSSASGTVTVTGTVTNADGTTASGTLTLSLSSGSGTGTGAAANVELVAGIPS